MPTDKGYEVGGRHRAKEVETSGPNGPTHPHRPGRPVPAIQPDNISMVATLRATRQGLLYDVKEHLGFDGVESPVCAEMGVYEGIFTGHILNILRPKEMHLFDLNTDPLIREIRERANVIIKEGDSSRNMKVYPDEYFDFIYIDGDHSISGAERDAQVAKCKVKRNGFIQFNDYTLWSFYEAAEYGVCQAANSLLNEGFSVWGFSFMPDGYHDILLRRM